MTKTNFMTHCTTFSVRAVCALALAGSLLLFGGSEALAENCKHVHGRFVNQVPLAQNDSDCLSPGIGGCVRGNVIGVLTGDFFATNMTAFPSLSRPDVFFFDSMFKFLGLA